MNQPNTGRVFTGNRGQQQQNFGDAVDPARGNYGNPQYPNQPPQQGQQNGYPQHPNQNPLNQVMGTLRNIARNGMMGGSVYATQSPLNSGFAQQPAMSEAEMQQRQKETAIMQATQHAMRTLQAISGRYVNTDQFKTFQYCVQTFPRVNRDPQFMDQKAKMFAQMVMDSIACHNEVVYKMAPQIISYVAQQLLAAGGQPIQPDVAARIDRDAIIHATTSTMLHEFVSWLHIDRNDFCSSLGECSLDMRALIQKAEEKYDDINGRYSFIGQECPWPRSIFKNGAASINFSNPLLEVGFIGSSSGYIPQTTPQMEDIFSAYNVGHRPGGDGNLQTWSNMDNEDPRAPHERAPEMYEQGLRAEEYYRQERLAREAEEFRKDPDAFYRDENQGPLSLSMFSYETRHRFRMEDYFTPLKDGWMYGSPNDTAIVLTRSPTLMECRTKFPGMDRIAVRSSSHILIIRFNDEGYSEWRSIETQDPMAQINQDRKWTNPSEVLPRMHMEGDQIRTVYEGRLETTADRVKDGKIVKLGEMKPLEQEPNMLAIGDVLDLPTDEAIRAKIEAGIKIFDPNTELDAFIVPTVLNREFKLSGVNSHQVARGFSMLVKGADLRQFPNTGVLMDALYHAMRDCDDKNLVSFISTHLTDVANRYFLECRGIPDSKPDTGGFWMKIDNLFEDWNALLDMLKSSDPESLLAFNNLHTNDFLLTNLQLFLNMEEAEKHFMKGVNQESVEDVALARITADNAIVISRDTVLVTMGKDVGPMTKSVVEFRESEDPRFHAIIEAALNQGRKHFKGTPTVIISFGRPSDCPSRVVNFSDYDRAVIRTRALPAGQELVLAIPHK